MSWRAASGGKRKNISRCGLVRQQEKQYDFSIQIISKNIIDSSFRLALPGVEVRIYLQLGDSGGVKRRQ